MRRGGVTTEIDCSRRTVRSCLFHKPSHAGSKGKFTGLNNVQEEIRLAQVEGFDPILPRIIILRVHGGERLDVGAAVEVMRHALFTP